MSERPAHSDRRAVRVSKFLSLVLRHKPQEIGITLDEAGWVDVDTLLAASAAHRMPLTFEELEARSPRGGRSGGRLRGAFPVYAV